MSLPKLVKHYLAQKRALYAEIEPSESIYKAWIAIHVIPQPHPLQELSLAYDPTKQFIVRWYEVHTALLEAMKSMDRLLVEDQASNFMRLYVSDEDELEKTLGNWKFDLETLVPYWQIEFPFE
jgi:hypothetical protein